MAKSEPGVSMKIHGESELVVRSDHTPQDVEFLTRQVLDAFRADTREVLSAEAVIEDDYDLQVHVTLSATSYARAEAIMGELTTKLAQALEDDTTAVTERATELIPA